SALSILANEQHRFLCSLRAKDGGAEWRAIYADAAAAPDLLAELRARRLQALQEEQRRLAEALRQSEAEARREPPGPNAAGYTPAPTPGSTSSYRPR
ncbi:hypothetical protein, partial [Dankookia rubra]|uniref:hypothetical protein n=1 Tax=Dankookia rubra TaxID=1442381 RepID=UPI0019D63558